jgi:TRAP-type C4-dicarboxylate transport system substrate-binding protein
MPKYKVTIVDHVIYDYFVEAESEEAAREAAKYQRSLNAANAGKVVADLKKSGMQVIENVDMAPFQKIVSAEIAKTFGEKNGPALLQAIENTK